MTIVIKEGVGIITKHLKQYQLLKIIEPYIIEVDDDELVLKDGLLIQIYENSPQEVQAAYAELKRRNNIRDKDGAIIRVD